MKTSKPIQKSKVAITGLLVAISPLFPEVKEQIQELVGIGINIPPELQKAITTTVGLYLIWSRWKSTSVLTLPPAIEKLIGKKQNDQAGGE